MKKQSLEAEIQRKSVDLHKQRSSHNVNENKKYSYLSKINSFKK